MSSSETSISDKETKGKKRKTGEKVDAHELIAAAQSQLHPAYSMYNMANYPYFYQHAAQFAAMTARTQSDKEGSRSPQTSPTQTVPKRHNRTSIYNQENGPFFNPAKQLSNLFSLDRTKSYSVRMNARIDRGFFLADNDWTCYRRNYFQISSAFTAVDAHGHKVELPCLIEIEGRGFRTVQEFMIGIMCRTSNGSREIELVQHTAKRDKGPQLIPQPIPTIAQDPNTFSYGLHVPPNNPESSPVVIFERVQFKSATANNGKRRAAQQYHVLFCELLARCEDGVIARVASCESVPLVVRGRAPGHYLGTSKRSSTGRKSISKNDDKDSENEGDKHQSDSEGEGDQVSMMDQSAAHHMAYTAYAQSDQQQYGYYYPPGYDPALWAAAQAQAYPQLQQLFPAVDKTKSGQNGNKHNRDSSSDSSDDSDAPRKKKK